MATHMFRVGAAVSLNFSDGNTVPNRRFVVEAQMPPVGTSLQYRIRSEAEGFSRVAVEHQLSLFGSSSTAVSPKSGLPHKGEAD